MSGEATRDEEATRERERTADAAEEQMEALARDVLPALIARLGSSRLGELEVRSDGWRVRLRRPLRQTPTTPVATAGREVTLPDGVGGPQVARSPGVGYFSPGRLLAVGQAVSRGDPLGVVDVLGIEQEVRAPGDGVIGRIHAEPGQAVEYGQELASISPDGGAADPEGADDVEVEIVEQGPVAD